MPMKVNMMKMRIKTKMKMIKGDDHEWQPPVPVEGADEAKVETIVVSELATNCSGLNRNDFHTFFQKKVSWQQTAPA